MVGKPLVHHGVVIEKEDVGVCEALLDRADAEVAAAGGAEIDRAPDNMGLGMRERDGVGRPSEEPLSTTATSSGR
jgi:hypothetical protein